jgi:hypothetical protein
MMKSNFAILGIFIKYLKIQIDLNKDLHLDLFDIEAFPC